MHTGLSYKTNKNNIKKYVWLITSIRDFLKKRDERLKEGIIFLPTVLSYILMVLYIFLGERSLLAIYTTVFKIFMFFNSAFIIQVSIPNK